MRARPRVRAGPRGCIERAMDDAEARERERRAALAAQRREGREALLQQRNEQAAALLAGCGARRARTHGPCAPAMKESGPAKRSLPRLVCARRGAQRRTCARRSAGAAAMTVDEQRALVDKSAALVRAAAAGAATAAAPAAPPPAEARALPLGRDRHGTAVWRLRSAPALTGAPSASGQSKLKRKRKRCRAAMLQARPGAHAAPPLRAFLNNPSPLVGESAAGSTPAPSDLVRNTRDIMGPLSRCAQAGPTACCWRPRRAAARRGRHCATRRPRSPRWTRLVATRPPCARRSPPRRA